MKRERCVESALAGLFADAADAMPPLRVPFDPLCARPGAPGTRPRLWDLEPRHHCPIVGTCLDVDELKRFARRHGFAADGEDAFSLHVKAAGLCKDRNPLSEAIHKHLDRKFAHAIRRLAGAVDDAAVRQGWQEHFARGDVAGALWAALTHRAASAETRAKIYADVHMLSHRVGAGPAADHGELARLRQENAALKAAADAARRQRDEAESARRSEIARARAEALRGQGDRAELAALRERLAGLESGATVMELGRRLLEMSIRNDELVAAAARSAERERQFARRDEELAATRRERDRARCERDALERLLETALPGRETTGCEGACTTCERSPMLRNILCVGGRTSLVAQYRALADRLGIRLIHHDGGHEEAVSRLPDLINGADAVMCPADCVSHNAYYRTKSHCRRTGKPCLLFKGSGVSSFALALDRLVAGESTLPHDTPTSAEVDS